MRLEIFLLAAFTVCLSHQACSARIFQRSSGRYSVRGIVDECDFGQFNCENSGYEAPGAPNCVPTSWRCDGDPDCANGNDEKNCKDAKCEEGLFGCKNNRCIPLSWVCDGEKDCEDGLDEKTSCAIAHTTKRTTQKTTSTTTTTTTKPLHKCYSWQFDCGNGVCIDQSWECDGEPDCSNKADEHSDCPGTPTAPGHAPPFPEVEAPGVGPVNNHCRLGEFSCGDRACIPGPWECDGEVDCRNGADEHVGCR